MFRLIIIRDIHREKFDKKERFIDKTHLRQLYLENGTFKSLNLNYQYVILNSH